jgi:transposase
MRTVGIDLGKNWFHIAVCDERGKVVGRSRLTRRGLAQFIAQQPPSLIGMESCAGSQPIARTCQQAGHTVRIIAAQFVKPYLRSQKNDYNDAEAIAEAVTRPRMRFVAVRSLEQQDLQVLHRARDLLVREQTALVNQIRGFLIEYGLAIAQGKSSLHRALPTILEDATNNLTPRFRQLLSRLHERYRALTDSIDECDAEISSVANANPLCQRLMTIPGIGPKVATALFAAVGNAAHFGKGRDLAAWIGLVPRQDTTGGKPKLLGIGGRGNLHLRCLLIHGARSVMTWRSHCPDKLKHWAASVASRRHLNVAVCALANKIARIAWAVLRTETGYDSDRLSTISAV